nr:hypothetical protein [Tanacetum cinerariifolium]
MLKYGVNHRLSTTYHSQTSGQVELSNRGLKRILERTIGENRASWKVQLNELNELRDQAYENSLIYKDKTKKIHDSKIKNHIFNVGDRVLLSNSHLMIFSGKLKTRWTGPFTVAYVFPYETIELSQAYGPNFKTSGQVESSNRVLKCILERTIVENHASLFDKLDDALWAFRTAFKTPIGCTPYKNATDLEASRARGFVHRPLEFQSFAYGNPISLI